MIEKVKIPALTDNVPTVFAMNPREKNDEGKVKEQYNTINKAWSATAGQIMSMLTRKDLAQTREALRSKFDEQGKLWKLPYLCPHYAAFRNDHRAQEDIIPEAFTHDTCVDVDDPVKAPLAIERALALNKDELSEWKDSVLYIEYSARKPKAHIWIRMPKGKTIEESQLMFCSDLGDDLAVEPDPMCFTPERLILMTGDVYYKSDHWLQPLSDEEIEERREAFLQRGLDVDGRPLHSGVGAGPVPARCPAKGNDTHPDVSGNNAPSGQRAGTGPAPTVVEATDRTRYIVQECLREAELEVKDLNTLGGIHNAVKCLLSVGVTQLLSEQELMGVLRELMPQYWQEKNIVQLVRDFYSKYYDPSTKMTQFQRRVFARSRRISTGSGEQAQELPQQGTDAYESTSLQAETQSLVCGDTASLADIYASPVPPVMGGKKPALVKLVSSRTPLDMKATVEQGMFPALGVYPRKVKFLYIDNQYRELRSNCLCIADTGSGKDTSLKQPLKYLTAPLVARDAVSRERLKKYYEEYNSKASNKEKPKRPEGAIIQCVSANLTAARLAQLMDDSQGAFLYTHLHEFEQWYGIEGKTGSNCTFTNLKLADDEDNPFGQERAGAQSVNYTGPLGLNWNASTTPSRIQQMFRYVAVDGPLSRCCLSTAVNRGLGAPIPKYGCYDDSYGVALKPYLDNLMAASGEIDCKQARRMIERLKAECDQFTQQTQDEVFDNLNHRALVHTFRKACILYAANGMRWERCIEGFCRWSLHYDLWLKLHFFSDLIRSADSEVKTSHRGPRNLLAQLSQVFTRQDAASVRQMAGKDVEGTGNMLSQWKCRGYIEELPDGNYRKIAKDDR